MHNAEQDKTQVNPEREGGKFHIKFVARTEDGYYLFWEKLKANSCDNSQNKLGKHKFFECLFNTGDISGTSVISNNRLSTECDTDADRNYDAEDFHYDSEHGKRNVRTVFGICTIANKNVIHNSHNHNDGRLC